MKRIAFYLMIGVGLLPGCGSTPPPREAPSPRLIAFSPALTRIVFDLGLGDHIVGVSKFSLLPPGETRPVVGSALDVRAEPILAVRPDVILAQMNPKRFASLRALRPDLPIEQFSFRSFNDVAEAMERIGRLVHRPDVGNAAAKMFRDRLETTRRRSATLPRPRTLFVVDVHSPLGAGKGTFLDEMIQLAGGTNVLAETLDGWRKPSLESVLALRPEVIICQCKPTQVEEAQRYWRALLEKVGAAPRVYTVTDPGWTIPSGRLADAAEQLLDMIHPSASTQRR